MGRTPWSGPNHYCSRNPSDSSDDSKSTVSANLVIPNVGYQQDEVDSGRVVSPVGEDGTSDSERTVSFDGIPCEGYGGVMEADTGHCKAGDPDKRSDAEKKEKHTRLKTDKAKSVVPDHRQQVIALQPKRGLLKMLPENKVVRGTGDSIILSKNTETDVETSDGNILADRKMVLALSRVQDRKEYLPIPQWLKDYKSAVADSDGWQHWQVPRQESSVRKDKYYTHRDYDYTFRSKKEVKHFLDKGEVKGKGLLQKKSSDPGEQSSGPRRSTKRRMVLPASYTIIKPQGYGLSTGGEMIPRSSKLPHGFV